MPTRKNGVERGKQKRPAKPERRKCPFIVVIDSNEGAPWSFSDVVGPSGEPYDVKTCICPLYLWGIKEHGWPVGLADYSIAGWENEIQIERKSPQDLINTLCARRDKFESEICRLDIQCETSAIIIESDMSEIAALLEGRKISLNSIIGTIKAWRRRYPSVQWIFARSRQAAQQSAFDMMLKYWVDRKRHKARWDSWIAHFGVELIEKHLQNARHMQIADRSSKK